MTIDEFEQNIAPYMRHGWVAMDRGPSIVWRWYIRQPYPDIEKGVWVTDMSCKKCSLANFDMPFIANWPNSLIEVGINNEQHSQIGDEKWILG